jgi:hypothetical protein
MEWLAIVLFVFSCLCFVLRVKVASRLVTGKQIIQQPQPLSLSIPQAEHLVSLLLPSFAA